MTSAEECLTWISVLLSQLKAILQNTHTYAIIIRVTMQIDSVLYDLSNSRYINDPLRALTVIDPSRYISLLLYYDS